MNSRLAALLFGSVCLFPLTACGDDDAVKTYTPDQAGVEQCRADHPEATAECEKALQQTSAEHETTVPHYSLSECMDQYGPSACVPRDSGSYFVPVMAGFIFGYGAGVATYHPYYVNLSGNAYYGRTVLGTYRPGVHMYIAPAPSATWVTTYHTRTVVIPRTTPSGPPSYSYSGGAPHIERGGIGQGRAPGATAPAAPAAVAPAAVAPQAAYRPPAATPQPITRSATPAYTPSISRGGIGSGSGSSSSSMSNSG